MSMKKTLLSLFVAVMAAFTANAQDNLLKNAGFEEWADGKPANWTTKSSAGNATLAQSTDAKSGTYAVAVSGVTNANKRLGYNEVTLKKGTYTFSVNAKSSLESSNSVLGYTPVDANDKAGNYVYAKKEDGKATDYTTVTQAWTPLSFTFTLTEDTRLALVVMAGKVSSGTYTLLVDDANLTTTDGGIVEGTTPTPDPTPNPEPTPDPTPEAGVIYQKALTDNAEGWTLDQTIVPQEIPEVWKQDAKFGLKASAFKNNTKTKYASEAWAISPAITLTTDNVLTFEHVQRYAANPAEELTLWICEANAAVSNWVKLPITHSDGTNWEYIPSGNISLSAYNGKTVKIGFKYVSSDTSAATWEFKNFKVVGTPNSINAVATEKGENVIFDLSGRRVKKAENGIYIINGVKQLVK